MLFIIPIVIIAYANIKMRLSILTLALLSSTVLADGASILAAMSKVANATVALNETVTNFPSGLAGLADVLPLLVGSITLLSDINQGISVAQASANLTLTETVEVASATTSLVSGVQSTLLNIENSKPKFDALLLVSPVLLLNLKLEKEATDKFSAAIISKLPAAFASLAESLTAPIDTAFDAAIADYEGAV